MNFDFKEFLELSSNCVSKFDFLKRISDEEKQVSKINDPAFLEKQHYLKRLDNARFCTEHGVAKEEDTFNSQLYQLLKKLK